MNKIINVLICIVFVWLFFAMAWPSIVKHEWIACVILFFCVNGGYHVFKAE